jgi:hypothetical protein
MEAVRIRERLSAKEMEKILTQEELHQLLRYEDGALYWKKSYQSRFIGRMAGCIHDGGPGHGIYWMIGIKDSYHYTHRIIFFYHHGYFPKLIDHINGNTLDNRIENLREADPKLNTINKKVRTNTKSGHKGVTWEKRHKGWRVRICDATGKRLTIGVYKELEAAASAYKNRSIELYNEWRE